MTVSISISLAVVLGIAMFVLHKSAGLKLWHAAVCTLFGFCLASTAAAPVVRNVIDTIVRALGVPL